jgi:hypothetical protein
MPELLIDDVHRLLETAESAIRKIDGSKAQSIEIFDLPELVDLAYDIDSQIGINVSLLNKIRQIRGKIKKRDARMIADRFRTYLKGQDQAFEKKEKPKRQEKKKPAKPSEKENKILPTHLIPAEQWIFLSSSTDTKIKISVISSLLDSILHQITHSNVPAQDQLLTEIERQQLISILETALNLLRSPMVETGLLKKARTSLQRAAKSAIENELQQGLGVLMSSAGDRLVDLLRMLGIPM